MGESISSAEFGRWIRCGVCLNERNALEQTVFCLEGDKETMKICMQCIIDTIKWIYDKRKDESLRRKNWWRSLFSGL